MTEQKVNRKKKKHFLKRIAMVLSLVLSFNILFPSLGGLIVMAQAQNIREINSFQDFFIFANASKTYDYEGKIVQLNVDLDLEDQEIKDMLQRYNVTHLTIGTKDRPFKGTFDGQNHTIKDLIYDPGIIKDPNSGLFSFTDGATIKNLTLKNASIECIYQGGIIVGHAKNTHLENITILNSKIKISPANNVLSLITNLGFSGGGIAGIMENSTMYNCEISGTEVVNNNTSGVTGVGGEGLYMGGLVGWMEDSTIEYSRVRSNYVNEGGSEVIKQSQVRNDYDIAVGALGGKSVYAGGIVGGVNTTDNGTTNIIDCFSTAEVSFYAANYVAVGSGIAGYAGGITGALRGNSHVERCHYAGDIHSKQYNAILVIPIIQTDVHISGISNVNKGNTSVTNSYFKRSSSKTDKSLYAVGTQNDTEAASAKTDDVYADQSFWESKGYDMNGTIGRTSVNSPNPHYNKWVMDYDLGIPVHGETVGATFNFPEAAKVTVDKTALVNAAVSTEDPYLYATQGIHPRGDHEVILTVEPKDSNPNDKIAEYRFDGWHKKGNILSNYTDNIQDLDCTGSTPVSTDKKYTYNFTELSQIDNSLFIADMKARVAFHEVNGTEISSDYYKYEQSLNNESPKIVPEKSMFYGWTNIPNPENNDGGYPAITSSKLEELKQQDAIYQAGDPVEKAMDLYPIFKNNLANIKTEFEGHELDDSDLSSLRKNVGETIIGFDDQGAFIDIKGAEANGNLPDGYRFLGWYRQDNTQQGATQEICVSKEQKYYVPDVSEPVTYVARLEYRLDYFVSLKQEDEIGYDFRNFYTQWVKYQIPFDAEFAQAILPKDYDHVLDHWSETYIQKGDSCHNYEDKFDVTTVITDPHKLYAHWISHAGQFDNISVISDFPNAAKLEIDDSVTGKMRFVATPYSGYQFHFWGEEQRNGGKDDRWTSNIGQNDWRSGRAHSQSKHFLIEAHLAAEITFHDKNGAEMSKVLRTYENDLFRETDFTKTYQYPVYKGEIDASYNLIEAQSPSDEQMRQQTDSNHEFLGWIQVKSEGSQNGIEKDGYVWNQIYNVADDAFCTSNVAAALPYLVSKDTKVTETMDLYPVYTRYNIETTTNIHEVGTLPVGVNYPSVPAYTLTKEADAALGVSTITVTAYSDVDPVMTGDEIKYKLVGMKCTISDGTETNLWKTGAQQPDGSYRFTMEVKAGENYKFTAIYSPVVLVYHLDDQQTTHVIKNINSPVGKMPVTKNPADPNAYMVAWTKTQPANGGWCHTCQTVDEIQKYQIVTDKSVVKQSMDLYPIFVKSLITVNSNIDGVLNNQGTNPETIRFLQNENNQFSLVAKNCKGYVFKGWYTDYKNDQNPGTSFSEQATQALTKDQVLSNITYTAVYAEAIDINYHDFFGNVLYTAKTTKGKDRTFVQTVEYEPGKKQEIPVDIDAFTIIDENIHQIEQQQHTKIRFVEWRMEENVNGKTQYTSWKDFKNNKITQEVNLYPVAYEVGFYTPAPETAFTGIDYSVQQKADGSKQLDAFFTGAYDDPEIKITTKEHTWERENLNAQETTDPSKRHTVRGLEGIHTDVYMTGLLDKDGNATYLKASDGTVDTDKDGIAIHKLLGSLVIKKDYADQAGPNETLVFKIQKMNAGAPEGEAVSIPMTLTDGQGECQIRLPIGDYQVSEDNSWSWRDDVTGVEHNGTAVADPKAAVTVKMNVLAPETLVFHNARSNQNWFSDSHVAHNEFGKKPAGGETK